MTRPETTSVANPTAQPHTRDTLPTHPNGTAPSHTRMRLARKPIRMATPKRTRRGRSRTLASARNDAAEIEANTVPPPDPHSKTRTLRYASGKKINPQSQGLLSFAYAVQILSFKWLCFARSKGSQRDVKSLRCLGAHTIVSNDRKPALPGRSGQSFREHGA